MKFRIQIHDAEHDGTITSPEGCDGFPHETGVYYLPPRGFVLVSLWRVTPPPIPDAPPRVAKVRKAKPTK